MPTVQPAWAEHNTFRAERAPANRHLKSIDHKYTGRRIILEKAVGHTSIAQALDSLGYMKKMLITNKVTTHFLLRHSNQHLTLCTHFQLLFLG